MYHNPINKILAFASIVEVSTGFVLIVAPALLVRLLIGAEISGAGTLLCYVRHRVARSGIGVLANSKSR